MSDAERSAPSTRATQRRIGPAGTVGRVVLGLGFLGGALLVAPLGLPEIALGLIGFPLATIVLLRLRGPSAPPLRLYGAFGHLLNVAIAMMLATIDRQAALVFYGTAMLLAAAFGYAGCELFAFANRISGRDDQIACPVFHPLDAAESGRSGVLP